LKNILRQRHKSASGGAFFQLLLAFEYGGIHCRFYLVRELDKGALRAALCADPTMNALAFIHLGDKETFFVLFHTNTLLWTK
jgi:hypothetical protein